MIQLTIEELAEEQRDELVRLEQFYWMEAFRCEKAKAYLAGCAMVAASLEVWLILMVDMNPDEAIATGQVPMKKRAVKPLLEWGLSDLLRVAKSAGWLPAGLPLKSKWSRRKAKIGDYAEVVRMVRNLVHPARYLEDHRGKRVTAKYLHRQFEVVEMCIEWLAEHNDKALREPWSRDGGG